MRTTVKDAQQAFAIESDPRWASVVASDAQADGSFYYSVATTGVYCRPSCAARRARPENVRFHATREEAERAGFRPCRRCRPDAASADEHNAQKITEACRAIERSEVAPGLDELSRAAGLSPSHFQRTFKRITG